MFYLLNNKFKQRQYTPDTIGLYIAHTYLHYNFCLLSHTSYLLADIYSHFDYLLRVLQFWLLLLWVNSSLADFQSHISNLTFLTLL